MTIQDLITTLAQYPPDTPVVISGYEGGYNDISIIQPLNIQLNVNVKPYYGAHHCIKGTLVPDIPLTPVIYLGGINPNCDDPPSSQH